MDKVSLRLFVSGRSAHSQQVLAEVQRMLDDRQDWDAEVDVIDVLEQPDVAARDRILSTPTLLRCEPPPNRRVIGDLSNAAELFAFLSVAPEPLPV